MRKSQLKPRRHRPDPRDPHALLIVVSPESYRTTNGRQPRSARQTAAGRQCRKSATYNNALVARIEHHIRMIALIDMPLGRSAASRAFVSSGGGGAAGPADRGRLAFNSSVKAAMVTVKAPPTANVFLPRRFRLTLSPVILASATGQRFWSRNVTAKPEILDHSAQRRPPIAPSTMTLVSEMVTRGIPRAAPRTVFKASQPQ